MNAQISIPLLLVIRDAWERRLVALFLHNVERLIARYVKNMQPNVSHRRFHMHNYNKLTWENTNEAHY